MSELLPHLLRPYWLLLAPLPLWLLWRLWHRQRRIGRWQRLLPAKFQPLLLTRARLRGSRLPWIALGGAWALALAALLGPSWQRLVQPDSQRIDPLVAILEVTPAMLAADAPPTRLEQARRKLLDLLDQRHDAQTAVVVYAGSAHTLVPLSDDRATTANLLDAVSPAIMPEPGQRADLAIAQALSLLQQAGQGRGSLLLIASSLSDAEREAARRQLAESGTRLTVLGVGTPEGAPIARADGSLMKDERGAILMPRLDNANLRRLALESGGQYQRARPDDADLAALGLLESGGPLRLGTQAQRAAWKDQGHWLLLPLMLLAACAGRRGWLFAIAPLLVLHTEPSHALQWQDLWLRADQQGQRLLEAQRPADAAERFADPDWRAYAALQASDYQRAAELLTGHDNAVAHYNRGNALALGGNLPGAVEAYDHALELDPALEPARHNRALVEQLLEQQQREQAQQQPQPPQPQDASHPGEPSPSPASGGDPGEQRQTGENAEDRDDVEPSAAAEANAPADASEPAPGPNGAADAEQAQAGAHPQPKGGDEQAQAIDQWLRQIPDDPGHLLRQKFLYEQRLRREQQP